MNKFAIVTGASRGIGFAVAKYLAEKQYNLALIARNNDSLLNAKEKLLEENNNLKISTHAINIGDPNQTYETIKNICEDNENIDLLFNSAGIVIRGDDDLSIESFQEMFNVNVFGLFAASKAVLEKMSSQGFGRIVNLSSMSGKKGRVGNGGYCASKFAVSGFTESLFLKYGSKNINITSICPSFVNTDMTKDVDVVTNEQKIQVEDIVEALDYLMCLSKNACVPEIQIQCRPFE